MFLRQFQDWITAAIKPIIEPRQTMYHKKLKKKKKEKSKKKKMIKENFLENFNGPFNYWISF